MRTSKIRCERSECSSFENRKKVLKFPALCASSSDHPQVKETGDEDRTLTGSVFGNHLILKEIFKHLQVADLLKSSLVNSFWKSNARTVLRECKRCLVRIRRYNSCVDVKNFVDMLPRFHKNEIPFNGLSIRTPPRFGSSRLNENDCIQCHDPSRFTEPLLSLLTIRHLKLGWVDTDCPDIMPKSECPTVSFIKQIVAGSSSTLEELHFVFTYGVTPSPMSLLMYFLGTDADLCGNNLKILFPKLKFFKTPLYPCAVSFDRTEDLLDLAPGIKYLMGEIEPKHAQYLLKFRKVDILKQFIFKPGKVEYRNIGGWADGAVADKDATDRQLNRDLQLSLQLAMEQPKLEKLTVQTNWVKRRNPDDCAATFTQITEICHRLFESSFKSLHSLCISHLDLLCLQRSGCLVPTEVKQLTIYYMMFEPNHHNYTRLIGIDLKSIPFSKIFPYLEGVKLYGSNQDEWYVNKNIMELERIVKSETIFLTGNGGENSCKSVSKLKLKSWILYDWYEPPWVTGVRTRAEEKSLELLSYEVTKNEEIMKDMQDIYRAIFPNVTEFTYRHDLSRDLKGICKYFWTTWNNLESIKIYEVRHKDALANLDSDFLGIPEEQCRMLRKSDDYLNFFWQNQVGASIRNLTKLKLLRIEIRHNNRVDCCKESTSGSGEATGKPSTDPDLVFVSAAAATCTIAQMPKLTLEFVRQTCKPTKSKCRLTCHHLSPFVKFLDPVDIVREMLNDEPMRPNA